MKEKNNLLYAIIIIGLIIVLVILWVLIIKNTSSNQQSNNMPGMNNSESITYSAVKEITSDEDISDEEYKSTNKDENAISISGSVKSTLSNINSK